MSDAKPIVNLSTPKLWFVCGSQALYGPGPLAQVAENARAVAKALNACDAIPLTVEFRALVTTPEEVRRTCLEANADPDCGGLILWMHTFSPARMWIGGLTQLNKPVCHLHTQFNRDLPWGTIDMDFMNLNQAAHGDREAGHLHTRLGLRRKVVVGHWSDPRVQARLGAWARAAHAWADWQGARFARFGDNMRFVAVTEGDKVAAEARFGFAVNGYGVGDLAERVSEVPEARVDALLPEYAKRYEVAPELLDGGPRHESLRSAARLELGLRDFLEAGGFKGFTTTFEDLRGLEQLPGLSVQRLMNDGYGFGAEGDWKTAALLRALKVMAHGLPGGTSFMEDYTYHLEPGRELVLGAHMLEVCESIAAHRPRLEIHPLGIGGKADPVRAVFDAPPGVAINASLIDLGHRFRLIVAEVEAVEHPPLPNLPVARAVWRCQPDFETACQAWILAGGAHHTVYSYAVTSEMLTDFAEIAGIELAVIDVRTEIRGFQSELRQNDLSYSLARGIGGR
jgi:L-arabinose isomerase